MSNSSRLSPCRHVPTCPSATAPDHAAARVLADHTEQGWSLLCNGVVLFTDAGELFPDGRAVAPLRVDPRIHQHPVVQHPVVQHPVAQHPAVQRPVVERPVPERLGHRHLVAA